MWCIIRLMKWIIGVDEVGRGPLAGPVAIGVCAIPVDLNTWENWEGLRDSKKLSEKKRNEWFERIKTEDKVKWSVSSSGARIIDSDGIVIAIREAAARAILKLGIDPKEAEVLLDRGLIVPEVWKQEQFTKGDEKIPVIAIASIMAKVTRDKYMVELGEKYPLYGFEKHKGYGTKVHQEAIRTHGPIPRIHRRLFIRNLIQKNIT